MNITASCELHGHGLTGIPVLNPGDWFGKTWLLEIGGGYASFFLVVEARSVEDAIDELSDNEKYGHNIHVTDEDLGDYPENERSYAGNDGRIVDLSQLIGRPHSVKYHGDGLPVEGIDPSDLPEWSRD